MNKVLIVTYYWPPSGGAGVQRWLKFSKYLPEFGWEPIILTVDPEIAAYPVTDQSLKNGLPSSLKVYTTRAVNYFSLYKKNKFNIPSAGFANNEDNTFKGKIFRFVRGNFFLPDPRRGWNIYAFKKASELIEKERISYVITTSPPHSTQLIGLKLKKRYPSIKWIADLRDPWTDIYYYKQFYPTIFSKAIDLRYEKSVLKNADKIITVGKSLKTLFVSKVAGIEKKTEVITNGYDESDFNGVQGLNPSRFTITYVGTLSDIYPVDGFLDALKQINEKGIEFTLRFIGSVSSKQMDIIKSKTKNSFLEFIPYVDHPTAIKYMLETTVLLLIIPDHQSNKSIITGKIFEYIAAGKPIICLGPSDGDAAGIIKICRSGETVGYYDTDKICEFLGNVSKCSGLNDKTEVNSFSRLNLVSRIAKVLASDKNGS